MTRTALFATTTRLLAATAIAASAAAAHASCGSAFCLVNTNWGAQGVWTEPGWRADLRYEYVNQDQPRAGTQNVGIGQIPQHHDEVQTLNRNMFATIDYGFSDQWGISTIVPWIDRQHDHIHNHRGAQLPESWSFSDLGDIRVAGRYQTSFAQEDALRLSFAGVIGGLKLPTGKTDVQNASGATAERSLQPGTGTTDLIVGAYFRQALGMLDSSWFAQVGAQFPLNSSQGYKPGQQVLIDIGGRWEATDRLGLMLQLNAVWKGRDSGAEAEPEDSGGRWVFVSPGIAFAITKGVSVYGFVQLPIYQYVNGVQLVASRAYAAGISAQF
jgi:hypothetical protein